MIPEQALSASAAASRAAVAASIAGDRAEEVAKSASAAAEAASPMYHSHAAAADSTAAIAAMNEAPDRPTSFTAGPSSPSRTATLTAPEETSFAARASVLRNRDHDPEEGEGDDARSVDNREDSRVLHDIRLSALKMVPRTRKPKRDSMLSRRVPDERREHEKARRTPAGGNSFVSGGEEKEV